MNLFIVPPLVITLISGAFIGYATRPPDKPWSVTQVVRTRYVTIATQQALPEGWKRARPVSWGNIYRELKMARKPVGSVGKTQAKVPVKAAKIVKAKPRCRKGERHWYWNKKKGRKMYRSRKVC